MTTATAGRAPAVPEADVSDVLAAVASSDVEAFSGTLVSRSELGLPQLPTGGGGAQSQADAQALAMRLLTGEATVRVWVDGPRRQRAQILDSFDQLDLVHNGSTLWTYVSSENAATRVVVEPPADGPAAAGDSADDSAAPRSMTGPSADDVPTPASLASALLEAADPTTRISLGTPQTVAGRATWTVLVTPRTDQTLVAQAQLSVDTETGMPLRVQVVARGQSAPAVDIGFTDIDFDRPDAARFDFTPPQGATVTEQRVSLPAKGQHADGTAQGTPPGKPDAVGPVVLGEGWTAIVKLPGAGTSAGAAGVGAGTDPMVDAVTTRVEGGRAIRTALLTVFFTDTGDVYVGAVPLSSLQAAAA